MPDIEKAVKFMETIAADDTHGYSQVNRKGSPDYDCSSLVGTALHNAGFDVSATSTTQTLYNQMIKCGFVEIGINEARRRGDVFLTPGKHVVMCVDSNYICHASIDELGTIKGATPGDQTGAEICKRSFYYPSYGWKYHLRYSPTTTTNINFKVGIDVSVYQKTIDWAKVKASGVTFAILKIMDKNGIVDSTFEYNYLNASANGIHPEVYNYSYATTVEKATSDAKRVLQLLNDRSPRVWLDVEDKCLQGIGSKLMDIVNAYKKVIEGANCKFGIYTGLSFYNSYFRPYLGNNDDYTWWIARYHDKTGVYNETYKPQINNMIIWQYTDVGSIPGVSGYVDVDVMYNEPLKVSSSYIEREVTTEVPVLIMGKTKSKLNVRTEPSTASSVVTTLPSGSFIQMTGDLGGWYHIANGYVAKDYVDIITGTITANKLYLRSTPDKTDDSNKIGVLLKDTVVTICTAQGEWYHVLTPEGQTGWASGKYVVLNL